MRAVHPFKGSIDIHVVDIIMELAGESDGIQGVAVGDGVLAQRRCAGGSDPVLRADVDGQREIDNITGSYLHLDRADVAFRARFHGLDRQNQLAVLDFRAPLRCIVISAVDAERITLLKAATQRNMSEITR